MIIYTLKDIETPRLLIRPVQLGDEIPLNKAIKNSLVLLQKWQPWAQDPSIDATRGFIQRGVLAWMSRSIVDFPMVVIHKEDQRIIGASGFNDRSDIDHGLYEIGYWCDVDYQGQGLVTEYANALTRYAFEVLSAAKVVISMQVGNTKSIAVAQRLNFFNEGETDRDPLDCVSEIPEKNYIYSVTNMDELPPLHLSWVHNKNDMIDSQTIAWAREILNLTDNGDFASSRVIISTPWSSVIEFITGAHRFYLKHTPKDLSLEASIIQVLHDQFQAHVPEVIAFHAELNCFLMKDAGRPLREILQQKFDTTLYAKAIDQFTSMQLATANHVPMFVDMGVPDWRLDKLPGLYMQLLSQKELLIADGLSEKEISRLEALFPTVSTLCQKLSDYAIKETIVQPDFHDNNILIAENTQNITFIDLGEIVISHPFFALTNCLHQIKRHHALTNEDDAFIKLMDACLNNFTIFGSNNDLLDAFAIVAKLEYVYQALGYNRLMLACDKKHLHSFYGRGRLSRPLQEFITVCMAMDLP